MVVELMGEAQSWVERRPFASGCRFRCRQVGMAAARPGWRRGSNALCREDVLVPTVAFRIRRSGGCRDEGEASRLYRRAVLVLATASSPVETDAVVACLAGLDAV